MAAIQKKSLKIKVNAYLDKKLKEKCSKYAKERYNRSLSYIITAQLTAWVEVEDRKKVDNINQGSLL